MNETRTFGRAFSWLAVSAAFLGAFVMAGRWSISPLNFGNIGTWLDATEPTDAFVEAARWIGIVLAGYVVAVSLLVLVSEAAAAVRLVSASRLFSKVSHAFAVPVIRRRLVEVSAGAALTASVVSLTAGGIASGVGAVPVDTTEHTFDSTSHESDNARIDAAASVDDADVVVMTVQRGDTLVKLARAHYGTEVDRSTIDWLAGVNDLADANLIFPGQQLQFPPLHTDVAPPVAVTVASWTTHTTVRGDTVWDIIEARYGVVNADMVWTVSGLNHLENPHEIAVGMQVVLPPLGADGVLATEQMAVPETPQPAIAEEADDEAEADAAQAAPIVDIAATIPASDPADAPAPVETLPVIGSTAGERPAGVELSVLPLEAAVDESATVSDATQGRWASALPWAGAGAGTLVTLAGLISWRRRRRRSVDFVDGSRNAPLTALHDFDALVDLPLAEWAAAGLSELGLERVDATLAMATFGNDGLNVTWLSPCEAPAPWVAETETRWRLARSVLLAAGTAGYRAVGFPLLVTIGQRNDEHVLANLAAFSPLSVSGERGEELVGSIIAELATGGEMSDGLVQAVDLALPDFVDFDRVRSVSSTQLLAATATPVGRPTITVIDSANERLAQIVAYANSTVGDAVIVLGDSSLCAARIETVAGSATLETVSGSSTVESGSISFVPAMAPVIVERTRTTSPASAKVIVGEAEADWVLDDDEETRAGMASPAQPVLLRLFSPRLPSLDPHIEVLRDPQIRVLAALDSFGGVSQTAERIAERLGVSTKTVRTYTSPLRGENIELVQSDGRTWSLSNTVMSDVGWMEQCVEAARVATERDGVVVNLQVVWEVLERVTGPAYGAAPGSKEWTWVFDQHEPPCPADAAWDRLCSSVQTAVEVWDKLAVERDDDIASSGTVVSLLVRAEKAVGHVDPWPLLRAAAIAARRGPESGRQQIALRLAQLAAAGATVPASLVDEVAD